jgi:hypothetical protein
MKTVCLSGKIPDKHRKMVINKRLILATVGVESILILLKVPERDVLTLHMEQLGNENVLLW